MLEIKPVSDVLLAFPAGVVRDGYLPAEKDIPKEFEHRREGNIWVQLFHDLFFHKPGKDIYMVGKPGVDCHAAWRQIRACMGSYEPKHEHKVSGVAYMLSEWFESFEWRDADKDQKGSMIFFAEQKAE